MVDFKSAANEIRAMVNSNMRFGSYGTSVKNMEKVYEEHKHEPETDDNFGRTTLIESATYTNNGHSVASANKMTEGNLVNYSIWDQNTGRTYSSGWKGADSPDKFNNIAFGDNFVVKDTNNNGKVDEGDKVYKNDASGFYMFVKDLLSGNFNNVFQDGKSND